MNKGIVIGIIVVIIIAAVIGAVSSLNLETYESSSIENIVEDESTQIKEENVGRNLSVELTEDMGLSSP